MKTDKNPKREIIAMGGSIPIYSDYGENVIVRKIKEDAREGDFEITIPLRPKIFGKGKTKIKLKYSNTVSEYAQTVANLIRNKKERGTWE